MSNAYGASLCRGRALMYTMTREHVTNLLTVLLPLVALALFCGASGPAGRTIERHAAEHAVMAEAVPGSAVQQRADGVCQDAPDRQCHPLHHHGAIGATLLFAAARAAALVSRTAPARPPLRPSRRPGGPRPPDLHQLQLLRV
jgi:hypothetical protein